MTEGCNMTSYRLCYRTSYRCNADAQATQPYQLHRDELPCKNNTFSTRHNIEGRGDRMNKAFEGHCLQRYDTLGHCCLPDHRALHLNNQHHEFLKSHKHQFKGCIKTLGIAVIFFGINAVTSTNGFPQGHNFVGIRYEYR